MPDNTTNRRATATETSVETTESSTAATVATLVTAVEHALGFTPTESVVLAAVEAGRIELIIRCDITEVTQQTATEVAGNMTRLGATTIVLLVFTDQRDSVSYDAALTALSDATEAASITVLDEIVIRRGHWWSRRCGNTCCCPPGGRPVKECVPAAVHNALIGNGYTPFANRDELIASIAYQPTVPALAMRHLITTEVQRWEGRIESDGRERAVAAARKRVRTAIRAAAADPGRAPDPADLAGVIAALEVPTVRDYALRWALGPDATGVETLGCQILREAPAPTAAAAATLVAVSAYGCGNGALANICVDRACTEKPDYLLARVLSAALRMGMHPDELRRVVFNEAQPRSVTGNDSIEESNPHG